MLKTIVKVSTVTNLSDARYCAGMGVEIVGFSVDKFSNNYIPSEKVKEIRSWLAGVKTLIETESADFQEVKEAVFSYEPDFIQISDSNILHKLKELNKPIILKLDSDSGFLKENLERYASDVEYFLIEGAELTDFLRHELKEFAQNYPIILSCGVNSENVNELLSEIQIKGISTKSGNETRPGVMDSEELMNILEALEID